MPKTSRFVNAVNARGVKQRIPRHFLGHPILGAGFKVAPSQAETDRIAAGPSEEWTRKQLDDHAAAIGADTAGASNKDDVLSAIAAVGNPDAPNPDGTPPPAGTPPVGDDNNQGE